MSVSHFIAWRYSRSGANRSFVAFINRFSVVGITLGIAALIIVLSVMNGLEAQLKNRILGILPHIVVAQSPLAFDDALQSSEHNNTAGKLRGVLSTVPYLEREVIVQSRSQLKGLILQGVDAQASAPYSIIAERMVRGDYQDLRPGTFNVIISQILASQLNVRVGQRLRVISTEASIYTPLGRVPSQRMVTVAGLFNVNSDMDNKVILMHIDDAARLLRQKSADIANTRLYLNDAFAYADTAAMLKEKGLSFRTWRERQGALFDAVKMEKNMMILMLMLVIAVAAFNVISALVMVVAEKRSDIAILQTQGLLRSDIMKIFLYNGVINGLKGALGGVALGLLCAWQLNNVLSFFDTGLAFGENGQGLPIDIQWIQIAFIACASMVLCAIVSLYPAFKAASIRPANSLRSE
ncbi:lipoprotein-releasing ABC transporter permease subunit [Glaciecola siphonariae]|uniref:Lipoprotein-releasing ABC transporter permease subunit n=1 Tax=Glaciecola siphonariae TaxID=521012 RepID=A0ABV9LSR6_9ALTE